MKTIQIRCTGTRLVDIDDITPFQGGLKDLDKKDYEKLKKEILETGYAFPMKVWKESPDNKLFGGHQTLRVLKTMRTTGYEIPPVPVEDISAKDESEAKRRILQDASSYGRVNQDGLEEFLHNANFSLEFAADSFRLPDVNLDRMFEGSAEFGTQGLTDPDEIPEVKETRAKPGDIWVLGKHRLMCGDSTSIDAVEKLMDGEKADMVFTDPPYNIDYQGVSDKREKIKNDKMSDEDFLDFLVQTIQPSPVMYVCCSWQYANLFKQAMTNLGCPPKAMIVWDKVNPAQHLDKYFKQHEIIFYYGPFGGNKTLRGDVWQLKRQRNTVHPTMKPVELIEMALEDQEDCKSVYDSFGGSGSTLIACEKTARKCFMMELDPKYCSVILARWEAFTGRVAELQT